MAGPWEDYKPKADDEGPWAAFASTKAAASDVADRWKDVGKSAVSGLMKGAIRLPGLPGEAMNAVDQGWQWAVGKGLELSGARTPEQVAEMRKPIPGIEGGDTRFGLPTSKGMDKLAKPIVGDYYEPQTGAGRVADAIGEAIPAGLLAPGSLDSIRSAAGNALKFGALPGAAGGLAGEATRGTTKEGTARMIASLGAGGTAAFMSMPAAYQRSLARAGHGVTPSQFNQAEALAQEAQRRGVFVTPAETIQQSTGGASGLGDLQRIVESSNRTGGNALQQQFAARPGQMQAAVSAELDRIAPQSARPYDIAPAVQQVGEDAMKRVEAMRSGASGPYYQAAESQTINPNAVKSIANQFDAAAAGDKTGIISGPVSAARDLIVETPGVAATPPQRITRQIPGQLTPTYHTIPGSPAVPETLINDIGNLDRARKYLRDKVELPPFAAEAIPKEEAKVVNRLLSSLKDRMERNSPEFRQGRQEHERISKSIVEPFTNSPTGQLATASTPEAQRSILFPRNGLPNSERATGNAIESIYNRNPELAQSVVRQEAEQVANKTVMAGDSAARPAQDGGARFAAAMRTKDPQYSANFNEALGRVGGDTQSMGGLLNVLQSTGWRQKPGSLTAFNQEVLKDLKQGGATNAVDMGTKPLAKVQEVAGRFRLQNQVNELAQILMSGPQGVREIEQIARNGTGVQRALAQALISTDSRIKE